MKCRNCKQEFPNEMPSCPYCGNAEGNYYTNYTNQSHADKGGLGWGILGCCIPIVGLVLYLVWRDTKPKTAKAAGIGALVSVVLSALWYVLVFGIGIAGHLLI